MNNEKKIRQLVKALAPFAKMDRGGEDADLFEVVCQRGTASDLTLLTSGDFRRATEVLHEIEDPGAR
ncbi:hypothetical protein LCGC14_2466540 [marine sediment metagenome]|uniref:Uncharacterized protein n=1 Tax=marine sediment metagenome TaxID=412755 RepID=A0A0F9BZE6_9ZZZZ